jgi:hypothetical protein
LKDGDETRYNSRLVTKALALRSALVTTTVAKSTRLAPKGWFPFLTETTQPSGGLTLSEILNVYNHA